MVFLCLIFHISRPFASLLFRSTSLIKNPDISKVATKQTIKRKVVMALLRSDDAQGSPTIHSIKYRKKDYQIGVKKRVAKSFALLPGASKYKGNQKLNHEFLFLNKDEPDPDKQIFRILIDLLVEVDGMVIDHMNGENGNPNLK